MNSSVQNTLIVALRAYQRLRDIDHSLLYDIRSNIHGPVLDQHRAGRLAEHINCSDTLDLSDNWLPEDRDKALIELGRAALEALDGEWGDDDIDELAGTARRLGLRK